MYMYMCRGHVHVHPLSAASGGWRNVNSSAGHGRPRVLAQLKKLNVFVRVPRVRMHAHVHVHMHVRARVLRNALR
jgi:hypothetical protein